MCIYIHVLSHTNTYVIRLYHWGALVPDLALRGSAFIRWESWITKMFTLDHRSRLSWGDGWWKWLSFCMIAADCFLHQHLRDFLASPLLLMCSYLCPTKAMSFASKTKPGHARTTVQVTLMVWWISRTACRIMEHHATIQFSKSWHSVLNKHTCTERQPGISVPSQVNGWHMLAHVGTCWHLDKVFQLEIAFVLGVLPRGSVYSCKNQQTKSTNIDNSCIQRTKKLAHRHVRRLVVEGGFCEARIIKLRRALRTQQSWNLNGSAWICMDLVWTRWICCAKVWETLTMSCCILFQSVGSELETSTLRAWSIQNSSSAADWQGYHGCQLVKQQHIGGGLWHCCFHIVLVKLGQVGSSRGRWSSLRQCGVNFMETSGEMGFSYVFIAFPIRFIFIQYFIHLFPFSAWHIQCVLHPQVLLSQAKTFQELGLPRRAREEQAWNEN